MPFELETYLARIAYQGPREPGLTALHALTRAHVETIPFETIDVLLGRPIELAPAAVFDKLVRQQRGGYCFEHNGLFLQALAAFGFQVRPLGARVRLRTPDRSTVPARTHLFIEVQLDGEPWLTDVGFGGFSLTAALRWQADIEQVTPHDRRRLVKTEGEREGAERWFHQVWQDDSWLDVTEFGGENMPFADQQVANWYTSTHPASSFMGSLMVARALPDGGRLALLGDELRHRLPDGRLHIRHIDAQDLPAVLAEHFGIRWPAGVEAAQLLAQPPAVG
ncbi:MAG: arylamine N-acetyltransferase [Thauera sp.]|jgi:N-hydroxyarylamine O-acetyltransferase|nr:arylamine N-acetyltransferase [Thauera sp.]